MTTDPRVENINANLAFIGKRIDALQAACKMTLLFHSASPWDASKRIQWNELRRQINLAIDGIPGEIFEDATTKVLCDAVRAALGDAAR